MRGTWRIARIMGIDIMIDPSWLIIASLTVYSLGFFDFPRQLNPRALRPTADAISIVLGIVGTLLLFGSVLAHELAHSVMALRRGIGVNRITLFIFGGVAQINSEPDTPATEFLIAIMGPLLSLALAAIFGAMWIWLTLLEPMRLIDFPYRPFILIASLLARINLALALFNLAPGFPLDGGRVLRALLWNWWRDLRRATLWACRGGQIIALILGGVGAFLILREGNLGGIWYGLIAFFLWNAARDSYQQMLFREAVKNIPISKIMTRDFSQVSADASLQHFVDGYLLPNREQTFVVEQDGAAVGIIAHADLQRAPRGQWGAYRVKDVMTPLANAPKIAVDQTATAALAQFARAETEEIAVVQGAQIVGFIGRGEFWRFIRLARR
ncbi:MAG: site-2 protease family protein [Chloroflexi bacterium]|nr:site-2 protease family protein [Chloroflexota bacterium]